MTSPIWQPRNRGSIERHLAHLILGLVNVGLGSGVGVVGANASGVPVLSRSRLLYLLVGLCVLLRGVGGCLMAVIRELVTVTPMRLLRMRVERVLLVILLLLAIVVLGARPYNGEVEPSD